MVDDQVVSVNVTLRSLFRTAPGDDCPAESCRSKIGKIVACWDEFGFSADAVCDGCHSKWPVLESWTLDELKREDGQ